jgi:hypothetical protein
MEDDIPPASTASIRASVASQVSDCLWLDDLKNKYADIGGAGVSDGARCIICSLPLGSCPHNNKWLDKMAPWNKNLLVDESVDDGMNDMMDVLGAGSAVAPTQQTVPEFNFNNMRWCQHIPRVADIIGADRVQVSYPGCRGFHTAVKVGEVIVVFGGMQYKKTQLPQPFTSSVRPGDVLCLNDVYMYHIIKCSWHKVDCDELLPRPEPRYGHVCAALTDDTMLLYGGRSHGGKFLSDTWFLDLSTSSWTQLKTEETSPPPQGRVFSAACSLNDASVLLFGGTDGAQNYGDIWIFRLAEMRWERGVAAGLPPQPRYGHSVSVVRTNPDEPDASSSSTAFSSRPTTASMRANDNLEVIVMGGCTVNPVSEISAASEGPLGSSIESQAQAKQLAYLNKALQDAYAAEGNSAVLSGQVLANNIEMNSVGSSRDGRERSLQLRAVYQEAARAAARIAALEAESRALESKLMQTWYESQAMHDYNKRTAKHPLKAMDTYILSIADMVWMQQKKKGISGHKPPARMMFSAATVGNRYIVVKGGARPTALGYVPVDREYTVLYVLDTQSLVWNTCTTMASKESMNEPMHMANMEMARANQRVEIEHRRGMMLGAPGGLTAELLQARRLAEVSVWRKEMLLAELDSMISPPPPRWGASGVTIGSRILLYGGWTNARAASEQDTLVLDAEDDLERARRIEDEFQARIEVERMENEAKGRGNDLQSAFELRMILAAERERETKERDIMGICDILSRLPELTKPKSVRFVKSNEHTIWIEWDPVLKDAYGKPAQDIEYLVIMSGGYVSLGANDRVEVKPTKEFMKIMRQRANVELENKKLAKKKTGMAALDAAIREAERGEQGRRKKKVEVVVEDIPFFRGEIVQSRAEGTFDIRYDDGSLETRVKRDRVSPEYDHPDPSTLSGKAAERLRETLRKKEILKEKQHQLAMSQSVAPCSDTDTDAPRAQTVTFDDFNNTESELMLMSKSLNLMGGTSKSKSSTPKKDLGKSNYLDDLFDMVPIHGAMDQSSRGSPASAAGGGSPGRRGDVSGSGAASNASTRPGSRSANRNFNRTISTDLPTSYRIVYRGPALEHTCEGIVPLEVVNNEMDLVVTVKIAMMTIGTDYPDNAMSQMSIPIECSTKRTRIWDTAEDPYSHRQSSLASMSGLDSDDDMSSLMSPLGRGGLSVSVPPQLSPDQKHGANGSHSPEKKTAAEPPATVQLMSKKKKDIVIAVLEGNRTINMERQKSSMLSAGVFDHFV